jgi:hypothetical protein
VVVVALAMVVAWLMALDDYPSVALATSPVVLSVAPAAIALAVGLLVLPGRRHAAPEVDEQSAPGLWAMWNDIDRTSPRSSRTLLIDAELNAATEIKHVNRLPSSTPHRHPILGPLCGVLSGKPRGASECDGRSICSPCALCLQYGRALQRFPPIVDHFVIRRSTGSAVDSLLAHVLNRRTGPTSPGHALSSPNHHGTQQQE